jgi:hypothetical protein
MRRAVFVVCGLLGACAGRHGASAPSGFERRDPREIVREVAEIRGLPDTRPTRIVIDQPAAFAAALETKAEKDAIGPTAADTPAFFAAFDFPPPDARHGSSLDEVLGEQIIAFYDEWTHSVHVRADRMKGDEDEPTLVLAHEITHSLQVQNLPRPDVAGTKEEDQRLAQLSVLEGDAMLVMLAHGAWRRRIPLRRALARAAAAVGEEAFDRYAHATGADRALMNAPPLIRERLTFPYLYGLTFVGALWRAGGFPLVNRMYSALPASSEHILHPEKYLAGEAPIPVDAPKPPDGYQVVAAGRVGELSLRVILERCLTRPAAARAAAGWGGDAYSVVAAPGGKAALLWSTTWDDESEATEFETALGQYVECTRRRAGTSVMPEGDTVRRRGRNVALVRGISGAPADPLATALLDLPRPVPTRSPPLGTVTIPPLKRPKNVHPPYVSQGVYVNERLGLMAAVPPGAQVEVRSATSASFELRAAGPALGGIELSDQIAVAATVDEIHGSLAAAVKKAIGDFELEYVGGQDVYLGALGHGIDRAWRVKGTTGGMRAIVVPICSGTGSFVFWQIWTEPSGAEALGRWLASIRPTAWEEPPVCAVLNP